MRRLVSAGVMLLALAAPARAHISGKNPTFDAADISLRARTGTTNQAGMTGGVLRGGRYDLRNATMLDLIATAYRITDRDFIVGGPAWLERNRFDIAAKAPQDTRPMGGYVLTIGKDKPTMKEAAAARADDQRHLQGRDEGSADAVASRQPAAWA